MKSVQEAGGQGGQSPPRFLTEVWKVGSCMGQFDSLLLTPNPNHLSTPMCTLFGETTTLSSIMQQEMCIGSYTCGILILSSVRVLRENKYLMES